jgi:hypothetical protein
VQYNQVLQAVLLAQFEMQRAPGEVRRDIDLPDDIVDRALLAWQTQQQAAKLSSFQLEVSEALGQLGIEHELEFLTAVNLLSVDIAIVKEGACVVLPACLHAPASMPLSVGLAWECRASCSSSWLSSLVAGMCACRAQGCYRGGRSLPLQRQHKLTVGADHDSPPPAARRGLDRHQRPLPHLVSGLRERT